MSTYEVYALRYASHIQERVDQFLFPETEGGADPHDSASLDYFVWLIRNGDRTILVDTGFDVKGARSRNRRLTQHPAESLAEFGVDPKAITDVVITHLHWDHVGNLDRFPKATFHLQDAEMSYATGRCMCQARLRHPFRLEDVQTMVARVYDGRVRFADGDAELWPGVSVHLVPGHSRGLQCVRVLTERGPVVLASDACHLFANMRTGNPFPILSDLDATYRSWARLRELAGDDSRIIPGHDPEVMSLYPPVPGHPAIVALHREPEQS